MVSSCFPLPPELFVRIFPFYLAFGRDTEIVAVGEVLQRICPGLLAGSRLDQHFRITRPDIQIEFEHIRDHARSVFLLQSLHTALQLKGQMTYIEEPEVMLFLCSPWINDLTALGDLGLALDDFAIHDPSADFLFLLQAQNTALADTRKLTNKLLSQRAELRKAADESTTLYEIGREITSQIAFGPTLKLIVDRARDLLQAEICLLALRQDKSAVFGIQAYSGAVPQTLAQMRVQPGEGLTARLVETGTPMIVNDYLEEYRGSPLLGAVQEAGIRSVVGVPLKARGAVIGVLAVTSQTPNKFREDDRRLLSTLGDQAAIAIEKARLYEQVRQNAEALEAKVSERTRQLEEANLKLEAASRHKSQFLANMSHELRTPLNGILGYAQILRKDDALTTKQRSGLEIIQQSGEHLLGLINEILDLSKIESHKLETNLSEFSLTDLLDNIKSIFEPKTQRRNLQFRQAIASDLPMVVHGDKQKLKQILLNLIDNAIKFTARGEVVFAVSRDGERVRFAVSDTGCGIKPEDIERIFQPFQQVGEHAKVTEGTGLGLAISGRMVELLGGKLEVQSEFGSGSKFWFSIPLPESDVILAPEAPQRSVLGYEGPRRRVLIVDDVEVNRAVLMDMLKPLGFEVAEAGNGQAAVEVAARLKPDLILMDLRMPVMDGLDATRRIRKIDALQQIIIIPISASAYAHHRDQCLAAGANDFLAKPFRQEVLLELLRTHLGLEFIYAANAEAPAAAVIDGQASTWVCPPEHELAEFVDLARRGEVKNILKRALQLEQSDARYAPFAAQLRGLAEGIKIKELREFLNASTQP